MGARGPVPKRSGQRRRTNSAPTTTAAAAPKVPVPAGDPGWHPAAKRWYRSLRKSGQATFYEPSDWALAWLVAESISRDLLPQVVGVNLETGEPVIAQAPMKGASLAAYLKAMNALLVTEADRRRAGLELQRGGSGDASDDPDVPSLDDYRARLPG